MSKRVSSIFYSALALLLAGGGYALLTLPVRSALLPHATLLRLLFGATFDFDPEVGYTCSALGFAITPNCSGAKLFTSAFLSLAFGFPAKGSIGEKVKLLFQYAAFALPGAVLLSVLRIALSIPFSFTEKAVLIHTLISLAIHFGSLAALYAILYNIRRKHP